MSAMAWLEAACYHVAVVGLPHGEDPGFGATIRRIAGTACAA